MNHKRRKWQYPLIPDAVPTCGEHKAFFALLRYVDKMLKNRESRVRTPWQVMLDNLTKTQILLRELRDAVHELDKLYEEGKIDGS